MARTPIVELTTKETLMSNERTRTLAPGVEIPYLGFGTYLIPDGEVAAAVREAIRIGYRHIDTAEGYKNEAGVGAGIRQAIQSMGLSRRDIFVTTKLWPGNAAWGQTPKTTESTIASLNESLERLELDYVDLYLIHAPYDREQRLAQWRGLVALQEQKKARAIGVSNFDIAHIEELESAGLPLPHANQIELHPWSQKPKLTEYMTRRGIVPIAYSSLVPLSTWRSAPGQDSAKTAAMRSDGQSADSPFKNLATKYGVTESQVLLRWAIQHGYPVLPKSTNPDRIRQNADIFSFEIDQGDMTAIAAMDRGDGVAWSSGDPTKAS
ncbi:aldo/keto reductase [Pendulispora rubella]|uniref:Aldo/keto reductase n=1 Tax=Pendulispora rubella TaxID=2741070 RepID=A0ABZ2KPM2_9BACT